MAERHTGLWQEEGVSHEITVETPEPLQCARLFKHVSDVIWDSDEPLTVSEPTVRLDAAMPLEAALSTASTAVYAINERLALTGGSEPLVMRGHGNLRAFIPAGRLTTPNFAFIETENQDSVERCISTDNDSQRRVLFTDGHRDYSRRLTMGFCYDFSSEEKLVVTYNMHRLEQYQDETILLLTRAWFSPLAVRGYDQGEVVAAQGLSPAEETRLLGVIATIGGLSIQGPDNV